MSIASIAAMITLHPTMASIIIVPQNVRHLWHLHTLLTTMLIAWGRFRCTASVQPIITAMAKKYELRFDVNIFSRKKTAISSENYRNGDPTADEPDDPDEYRVYQMKKSSRDEQTERLRKLLGLDEEDK